MGCRGIFIRSFGDSFFSLMALLLRVPDFGMGGLEPARLAGLAQALLRVGQEVAQLLRLPVSVRPVALGQDVEIHRVGVELGAVHAGEFAPPPEVMMRQPPHMPVPSTISELRLTTVGIRCGRVVSATACIIRTGPMARTRSIGRPAAISSLSGSMTRPLRP